MLSKKKESEKGKCPFRSLKPCDPECAFYRKGVRYKEGSSEAYPFEDCVFNIIGDNLEAMHNRTYMMQKEVGDAKNIIALKTMVDLNMARPQDAQNLKNHILRVVTPPNIENKKLE